MSTISREEAPSVSIREATPTEFSAVCDLVTAAGLPTDGLTDADVVLVAVAGPALVGSVALERHGHDAGVAYLLRSAAVAAAWRGRGVGAALTAAALEHVDSVGGPVALLTETAEAYFPRFGFAEVDRALLPAALAESAELQGVCPASAHALMRPLKRTGSDQLSTTERAH